MKFKDEEAWNIGIKNNQDAYGSGIYRYARSWADLMESKIEQGFKIEDIADECSRQADAEGITGFMYGCAVNVLSQTWEYGEELRKWNNLDIQIWDEGEKANVNGGVLNPALLTINLQKEKSDVV